MNLARLLSRCKPVAKINSTSSSSSSSIACTSFFLPGQRRSYTSSSTLATTAEFVSAVTFLPHPDKGEHGEDAYFITDNNQVAGVADGVGGWVEMGIDAGAFSRELMGGAEKFAINENSLDPYAMLNSAYFSTTALGTCTACIIALDGKELRAIIVGDSGFSILRRQTESHKDKNELNDDPPHWALFFQTTEQVHFFNCPMQLGTNSKDSPSDGQQFNLPMEHGDIVILATDGLIDNLFTAELIQVSVDVVWYIHVDCENRSRGARTVFWQVLLISFLTVVSNLFLLFFFPILDRWTKR
jgi:protein phosphatase PTC7